MPISIGDSIGPYRIEETLADGDMVLVFKAVSEADGQRVALKMVQPDIQDEEVHKRFEREARVAGRVGHPNLVAVIETGRADGVPFMAMRYVPGRTLSRTIEEEGPLAFDAVVRLTAEVGAGLDALHAHGIVHRDVRASNVLVDEQGVAALSDFGFACSPADTRITELDRPVGTLDYRAPELFQGRPATRATDIYSLGCVAYECLVGVPPFADRRDFIELGKAHLADTPPDISVSRPDVSPDLASGVLTALAKDPGRRPPSGTSYARLLRFGLSAST